MGLFYLLTLYGFIRAGSSRSSDMGGTPMPRLPAVAGGTGVPPVGWQRAEVRRWLGLSVIACVCGMATKQIMVTAPVLVLLYDRAFVSGSFGSALANRRWYYASLAATWLLLGFLMHQSSLAAVSVGLQTDVSWPTYGLTELRVVTGYLKLALWPHPLVFDYGREILVTDPLAVAPYALIIVALLTSVVIAWRRSPMAGFLGCWFFLILAPTSTVVPIAAQPMAESRMYLPLAAVIVLVALWSYTLARRRVFVISGIVVVGLGLLAFQRNCDYRSELSIWEDTVARNPHTSRGHCNLGKVLTPSPTTKRRCASDPIMPTRIATSAMPSRRCLDGWLTPSLISKRRCVSSPVLPRPITTLPSHSRRCPAVCPTPSPTTKRLCV
jgi:hypothetical protein